MRSIRWTGWLLLALFLLVGGKPSVAQSDAVPYLMYFDPNYGSPQWVIENADATDSRPFGAGLMAADTDTVAGPGWSANGEWFAWTSYNEEEYAPRLQQPHVLSVDGSRKVTFPADVVDARLFWAPSGDRLVAITWHEAGATTETTKSSLAGGPVSQPVQVDVMFIDPAQDVILMTHRYALTPQSDSYGVGFNKNAVRWQGDQVLVTLTDTTDHTDILLMVFTADGNLVSERRLEGGDPNTPYPLPARIGLLDDWYSATGLELYPSATGATLRNEITGAETTLTLDSRVQAVSWQPSGWSALVETESGAVWYLSATPDLADLGLQQLDGPSDLNATRNFSYSRAALRWDASGRYVMLESAGQWVVYVMAMDEWRPTPYTVEATTASAAPLQYQFMRWSGEAAVFAELNQETGLSTVVTYNPSTGESRRFEVNSSRTDGTVGLVGDELVVSSDIASIDVVGATTPRLRFRFDARAYWAGSYGEIDQHPSAPYFIVGRDQAIAGGGLPMLYAVGSVDGTLFRETGDCETQSSLCAFWLPGQVDVSRLPAGQNIAAQIDATRLAITVRGDLTEQYGVWNFSADWSPDGTHFAIGGTFHSGNMTVYDAATLTEVGTTEVNFWESRPVWGPDGLPTAVPADYPVNASGNPYLTSPDGRYGIDLWTGQLSDVMTGAEIYTFATPHPFPPAPTFSPDGRYVGFSGTILDLTTLAVVHLPVRGVAGMAFSPDGTRLVTGRGALIEVWDVSQFGVIS